jgi:hypothetical protein
LVTGGKKIRRSKGLVLLMLPALVFIGFIGWLIYAFDSQRKPQKPQRYKPKAQQKDDGITFIPAFLDKEQEIMH